MDNFLLLLNYIFHDHPKWIKEFASLFSADSNMKENLSQFLATKNTSEKNRIAFIEKFNNFSIDAYRKKLADNDVQFITLYSTEYPDLLRQIDDPPVVLFYKGNAALLKKEAIGLVGTRVPSNYGIAVTKALVKDLVNYFVITSGLAAGIDTIAHQTALDEEQPTIAVIGTGLDIVYPPSNQKLFTEIVKKGVIVSEYPLESEPIAYHFPQRNRIISGLCRGIVVCEAPEKSGSLITAKHALEQNREIFAVPSSIFMEGAQGTHKLIQEGAKLVQNCDDIIAEFNYLFKTPRRRPKTINNPQPELAITNKPLADLNLTTEEQIIWDILNNEAVQLDEIILQSKLAVHQVLQTLTLLEINELIEQLPGKFYKRMTTVI